VLQGITEHIWRIRQDALEQHYAAHKNRYVNGPPNAKRAPTIVQINPLDGPLEPVSTLLNRPKAFASQEPIVETEAKAIVM
jgi:hypothetical protein